MITIEVNGKKMKAKPGETLLTTLQKNNIRIPALCCMESMTPTGACRLCVVEIEGYPSLVPSCSAQPVEGMKIQTHSERVLKARKTIIELLLSSHPDDCLYCSRNMNCELQEFARELGVSERLYRKVKEKGKLDVSSPSLVRDPSKCILCGRCVRVCEEVQGVAAIDFIGRGCTTRIGTAFDEGLNVSTCINCGQCIMVCPTGALTEHSHVDVVEAALKDSKKFVVVQHAPAVSVSLGEELGLEPGVDVMGLMVAALRRIGFDRVYDTSFSADLTIMEEVSELIHRVTNNGVLPMFTSCSPGWIKFVEQFYPEFIPNVSSCKSPQQMLGALIKSYIAQKEGKKPDEIVSVSLMPCTAKKFEAERPEMGREGIADIDAVLTTRELAKLIRKYGIDMKALTPEPGDNPFNQRSGAGKIFGATGGVMEAAVRTAYFMLTGKEMEEYAIKEVRDLQGIKETSVTIGDLTLGVAVVSGLGNARKILEQLKQGRKDLHFIEFMTCPGGCIAGGGQPIGVEQENIRGRMGALYTIDKTAAQRTSHSNPYIKQLYEEFLGKPLGHKSHELLHTHYAKRSENG